MENLPDSPTNKTTAIKLMKSYWPLLAGGILMVIAIVVLLLDQSPTVEPSESEFEELVAQAMASATPRPAYSADAYEAILPSLVFIQTIRDTAPQNGADESGSGFGVGSGVVINENGEVLTSLHVVADARIIEIIFADGTKVEAEIAGADPAQDIALLTPDRLPEILAPAVLGDPFAMRIGDEAFAVGNPFGLPGSMSTGVISGFDRSLTPKGSNIELTGLIQFDAAVNPGNSGGPLLNRQGHVVGIVTALANPTDQEVFIGIGFAVPIMSAVAGGGGGGPQY